MDRLTKLLISAISFAIVQTVNAAAFFQNVVGVGCAIFCWAVVVVVARRRRIMTGKS